MKKTVLSHSHPAIKSGTTTALNVMRLEETSSLEQTFFIEEELNFLSPFSIDGIFRAMKDGRFFHVKEVKEVERSRYKKYMRLYVNSFKSVTTPRRINGKIMAQGTNDLDVIVPIIFTPDGVYLGYHR
jgi:uncharacterized protein YqfB (UPF0267 family)